MYSATPSTAADPDDASRRVPRSALSAACGSNDGGQSESVSGASGGRFDCSDGGVLVCPATVHHNWFGPVLPDDVVKLLRENVETLSPAFKTVVWLSREFSDPGAFEANTATIHSLVDEGYNVEMREVDDVSLSLTAEDFVMLRKLWSDSQVLRRLREEQPAVYTGLRVTWIAAISDFLRMKAVHQPGGIWADIGDTRFPPNFPSQWMQLGLNRLPVGFRVGLNHSGIVRSPSQHLFCAAKNAEIVGLFIDRMQALWHSRISKVDVRDPSFDAISTTLAFTGMGGTTGPVMRAMHVVIDGESISLMDAWDRGWCHVRLGEPVGDTAYVQTGRHASDLIATWSAKSWMFY